MQMPIVGCKLWAAEILADEAAVGGRGSMNLSTALYRVTFSMIVDHALTE
jgi:hypothetical protein